MTRHYILTALRDIMLEYLKEPRWGLREKEFKSRSDKLWAVDEVLDCVRHSNLPPEEAISEFIHKCERFARYPKTRDAFLTARDVGITMLDLVRAMM